MKGSFITEHSVTKQYTTASSPPPLCKAREETPEGMEKAFPKQAALSLTCIGKGSTTRRSSRVTDELKENDRFS